MFYFLLQPLNDENVCEVNDQHPCVVFAQGLKKLDLSYCGNIRFLKYYDRDEYLIPAIQDISYSLCPSETIIVTNTPTAFHDELHDYSKKGYKIVVFDTRDEWNRHELNEYIPISHLYFKSSFHPETDSSPNIRPFAFALSNRIIQATHMDHSHSWNLRKNVILEAHRVTNHTIRNLVKSYYVERDCPVSVDFYNDQNKEPEKDTEEHFHWCQTGRRHSMQYYNLLKSVQMLDAHGGYLTPYKIVQIDSWKLWEGFAAGCLVIALDFKHYGIKLPFDLIGFAHYIPIRYDRMDECYQRLSRLTTEQKQKIAENGRKYVLQHYCPESMAKFVVDNM